MRLPSFSGGCERARAHGRLATRSGHHPLGRATLASAAVSTALALIPAPATAALDHPFIETFGSAGAPSFIEDQGLAFDQSGDRLLVIDVGADTVSRWNADGTAADFPDLGTNVIDGLPGGADATPQGVLSFEGSGAEVQVAVDNSGGATDGNIYVPQFSPAKVVDVFASSGEFLGQLTESSEGPLKEPCGVAVDPTGAIYVGDFSNAIHRYQPAANPPLNGDNDANFPFVAEGPLGKACALAAGAGPTGGFIFPAIFKGKVSKLDGGTGVEQYEVDPGPTTTLTVDPGTGRLFTATGSEVREFDASGEAEATPLTPIPSEGGKAVGIAVSKSTGRVYVARQGVSQIEVYGPPVQLPEPTTEAASALDGTVTLHGVISAAGGPPATCSFQYAEVNAEGFTAAASAPCSPAGPFLGDDPVPVSAQIAGLPEAVFRFRLIASNEDGSKVGQTLFFDTLERFSGPPDQRAYEMVSPRQKAGEVLPPEPSTQLGSSCEECLPGENGYTMPMQSATDGNAVLYQGQPFFAGLSSGPNEYLAPRSPNGWGTQSLSSASIVGRYQAFSPDLSSSVLFQANPPLSPQAPTRGDKAFPNLYLREGGDLQPLVVQEPPNRDPGDFRIRFATANAGTSTVPPFTHLLLEANDALSGEVSGIAPEAPAVEAGGDCTGPGVECDLYQWQEGELALVNVLPGNATAARGTVFGAGRLLAKNQFPALDRAISDDGSRVFFTSEQSGELYVRVNGQETLEIPTPGPGTCKESELLGDRVCFLTASADGKAVLLSDGRVYEADVAADGYEPTVDLSEGQGGFRGILGTADDLSRIYFVDSLALTGESEVNANGEHALAGAFNLFAWQEGDLAFIGILLQSDREFGSPLFGGWTPSPSHRTAQVSADGRHLAFMSAASLTGYDNLLRGGGDCNSAGPACREVFVYTADSGVLSCVSCNPTGQRPLGPSNLSLLRPTQDVGSPPLRQPGNLSREGSGRLFFESQDELSSRDLNGHIQDVYEWEPQGIGSCRRDAGCVYLISSGADSHDSIFLDSSESGDDAFFITRERLLPRDRDEQLDLYDARVYGGIAEEIEEPCLGEACKGAPLSAPDPLQVPTLDHFGPGNPPAVRPCRRGFARRHGKCVRKHRKKHHRRHRHHRAGADRRATR